MTRQNRPIRFRGRVVVAATLALVAVGLFLLDQTGSVSVTERTAAVKRDLRELDVVIEQLFARHGIRDDWIRTWQVRTPDRALLRTERRVFVPPTFVSVAFNHELNAALEPFGARAVATERTREQSVTVHIKSDETIIESITFVLNRDLEPERKESGH